jgi:carbon-monoxide dehydrogenase medium subunit
MYEFTYHKPGSLADAAKLLGAEDAKLVAGGMTLVPTLKLRLAKPSDLVDLATIASLKGIKEEGGGLTIGAMTRHIDVHRSSVVKSVIPALAALAGMIGDPAVRNRGTMGGSVANNDPAADYPSAVVGLGATVVTTKREIKGDDFFTGMFETALAQDEIITAIKFPKPQAAAYQKFKNPASRYAIVGVFVARTAGGVRVAVTGAGPCVFRVPEMEAALGKSFTADAIKDIAIPQDDLNTDIHASAEYRAHLVNVMARRAVAAVLAPQRDPVVAANLEGDRPKRPIR